LRARGFHSRRVNGAGSGSDGNPKWEHRRRMVCESAVIVMGPYSLLLCIYGHGNYTFVR
jgi:hypothetical protein